MKKRFGVTVFFCFLLVGGPLGVRAEETSLKIQAIPDQTLVKTGMMFLAVVKVINQGKTPVDFWANDCSYEKHWVTDNPEVLIQPWTCKDNDMEEITLENNGDLYEKSIVLHILKVEKPGPVTFRLGFKRMSENGDVAEPLWSDPATVRVIGGDGVSKPVPPEPVTAVKDSTSTTTSTDVKKQVAP